MVVLMVVTGKPDDRQTDGRDKQPRESQEPPPWLGTAPTHREIVGDRQFDYYPDDGVTLIYEGGRLVGVKPNK